MQKLTLIACGNKMPAWVIEAVSEFAKRLKEYAFFNLIEIPLGKRGKSSHLASLLEKETSLITAALPPSSYLIALDSQGEMFSSELLAQKMKHLQQISSHLCFIIGGPEGLNTNLQKKCHARWSLSRLTLPHPLVRVILLETLYRTWTILHNHPYHK